MNSYRKSRLNHSKLFFLILTTSLIILNLPENAWAYIGPGAGFALLSSVFVLLVSFFLAILSLLTLPFRMIFLMIRRQRHNIKASAKRVVILGFDGMDPDLCETYMKAGLLPNFSRLKENGGYRKLNTTYPSLSPVAWSTFATGVNPAQHRIYDFLMRNPRTYLPELSSSKVEGSKRTIKIGKYEIPIGKPTVAFLRKSQSFWKILGNHGIFSHIIRVPITFPPEKFHGAMLSAMCTPDLRGTQGTFSHYTLKAHDNGEYTGGTRMTLTSRDQKLHGELIGPNNPLKKTGEPIILPFKLIPSKENNEAQLILSGNTYSLKEKELSPWIKVVFKTGLGVKIRGICQFYFKGLEEPELYVSPINIDPENPALPISYPHYYAIYLAKLLGSYGTLGLTEDTWALNEHVLDEKAFLEQVYQIHNEREKQLFHTLKKSKKGCTVCVFDLTDRTQHMFFRYLVKDHPANRDRENLHGDAIQKAYQKADEILARVLQKVSDDSILMVMSDHGFKAFTRGINLNTWLKENGYLKLKKGMDKEDYLQNVDWENTKAYAIGLAGMYINQKGREREGIVETGKESEALKKEIIQKLTGMKDPKNNTVAINKIYDTKTLYSGPYLHEAPDLIVGYNIGYRISWDAAIGKTADHVFEDNTKFWSGDHGIDPQLVPGVLFCNHPIGTDQPEIVDIAPTVLKLFGIPVPKYMNGRSIHIQGFIDAQNTDK